MSLELGGFLEEQQVEIARRVTEHSREKRHLSPVMHRVVDRVMQQMSKWP